MLSPNPIVRSVAESSSEKVRVLVVDDDANLVATLDDILTDEGYVVEGFTDPLAALARLRKTQNSPAPDVVLSDCVMPTLTGGEALRRTARSRSGCPSPADDSA